MIRLPQNPLVALVAVAMWCALPCVFQRPAASQPPGQAEAIPSEVSVPEAKAKFRVVSKTFVAGDGNPFAEHLTLFDSGVIYDLPRKEARFTTVFDPALRRVTLLDRETQVQTVVSTVDLTKITAQARASAKTDRHREQLGLLATVQEDDGQFEIRFGTFRYQMSTRLADNPTVAMDYGRFVDLAARLNIVRRLGPPPFGRMSLNDTVTANRRLPIELSRTVSRGQQTQTLRKTHEFGSLREDDRKEIDEVRAMMTLYRDVPLDDFPES